jgi:hypothetical protein
MGNFAVIICDDRNSDEEEKLDLLRKIKLLYQRIFFTNVLKNIEALRYELYENTVLFTVRLPYKLNELCMINRARTERFITELAAQNDIRTCIIPDKLQDKLSFKGCTRVSAYS